MAAMPGRGMVHLRSHYSVQETLQRVEVLLHAHGLSIFCRVDHSGEAEKVGLKMPPTQVLIFGGPKAGTPLMVASPTPGHRSAPEGLGMGRRWRHGLALLQQP
jgi:uncharacterized protein (DUF302 family)